MDGLGSSASSSLIEGSRPTGGSSILRASDKTVILDEDRACRITTSQNPQTRRKILLRSDEWDISDLVKTYRHLLAPNEKHLPYDLLIHSPLEDQTQYAVATALELGISIEDDASDELWKVAERQQKIKRADVQACMQWMFTRLAEMEVELQVAETYDWNEGANDEILNREQAEKARQKPGVDGSASERNEPIDIDDEAAQEVDGEIEAIELFPEDSDDIPLLLPSVDNPPVPLTTSPGPSHNTGGDALGLALEPGQPELNNTAQQADAPREQAHPSLLVLGSSWKLPEIQRAYRHILHRDEADFPLDLLRSVPSKERTSGHFVLTVDLALAHYREHGDDRHKWSGVFQEKGYHTWGLTYDDLERCMDWLVGRMGELDMEVTDLEAVKKMNAAEKRMIINKSQIPTDILDLPPTPPSSSSALPATPPHQNTAPSDPNFTGSVIEQALSSDNYGRGTNLAHRGKKRALVHSESDGSDDGSMYVEAAESDEEMEDKTQKKKCDKNVHPAKKPRLAPSISNSQSSKRPTSFGQSQRWTARQKYALVMAMYEFALKNVNWGEVADKVNTLLPVGTKPRPRSRVRSHFRETLFPRFKEANNSGKLRDDQLDISWPDLAATGAKGAWTKQEQQVVWKEAFAYAQSNVEWKVIAVDVNKVAVDAALHRKGSDCMKTWNDTVARHFFLPGRNRKK